MLRIAFIVAALIIAAPAHAQWHASPDVKALYEKAKAEKKVVVWGTQRTEVEWIPAAFNALSNDRSRQCSARSRAAVGVTSPV